VSSSDAVDINKFSAPFRAASAAFLTLSYRRDDDYDWSNCCASLSLPYEEGSRMCVALIDCFNSADVIQ
jgi:hypothetical protein